MKLSNRTAGHAQREKDEQCYQEIQNQTQKRSAPRERNIKVKRNIQTGSDTLENKRKIGGNSGNETL